MITTTILEDHDIITEECFVRPLEIFYDNGYGSDYAGQESMYDGKPQNRFTWTEITRIAPLWVNSTVKEYNNTFTESVFCKGTLPKSLITPLTITEFERDNYNQYLAFTVVPFVKKFELQGLSLAEIKLYDKNYFEWLMKSEEVFTLEEYYREYINNYYK